MAGGEGIRVSGAGWQLDMGAQLTPGGVHFRVWAPNARQVEVEIEGEAGKWHQALPPEGDEGVFSGLVPGLKAGARYRYRLDAQNSYPDPYSRCQPLGVHGPSEVVDPEFPWEDEEWLGSGLRHAVIYEVHVGTYTPQGTFEALTGQLEELKSLGVTALQLMPVAEFPGRWNWGYDGVFPYAPSLSYGGVVGLKRLVNAAHRLGLAVFLDAVYNHFGPNGNYLSAFAREYFTDRYRTPWGSALNYDGPGSRWVRHFAIQNACYWLNEYHVDGLRLDATHAIFDQSPVHLLRELSERARASVSGGRTVAIVAEDSSNDVRFLAPAANGGYGLDGVWADDFHHALHTYLTGERDGYYEDYSGRLADVGRAIRESFLYQGQMSRHLKRRRGTPVTDEEAYHFVFSLQNHDQIGNRAFGERLSHLVGLKAYAVASTLLLLAPQTPLLFMGQEFAASAPFQYFTDHDPELGKLVTAGRRQEFGRFAAFGDPVQRERIPDPQSESTFWRSHLDLGERARHANVYRLYRDLIALRQSDPVFSAQDRSRLHTVALDETVLGVHVWNEGHQRLLVANFGGAAEITLADLLAPGISVPPQWRVMLSTVGPAYTPGPGGPSLSPLRASLSVPPACAVVLEAL